MNVTNLFFALLATVSFVMVGVVIPYLKQKTKGANLANTLAMVEIAVKAAEQIYSYAGQGAIKKKYVLQYLKDRGISLQEEELDAMIEATVQEINRWKKELQTQDEPRE